MNSPARVLVIAPHADDEVLGVGGTLARLSSEGLEVHVAILTGHGPNPHPLWKPEAWETVRAEARKAHCKLGVTETHFREIPAAMVSDTPVHQVNRIVRDVIEQIRPTVLFVPFLFDLHKDHREITYACSVAYRPTDAVGKGVKEIYMYETLSETHWNIQPQEPGFLPNTFIDISGKFIKKKLEALALFRSQMQPFPHCRSLEAIEALAKWRGSLVGIRAAEAFVLVRRTI